MYKKNNLDLKLIQHSDRQKAELQALQDYLQGNTHFFSVAFWESLTTKYPHLVLSEK